MKKLILFLLVTTPFLGAAQKDSINTNDDFEELIVPEPPSPPSDATIFEVVEQMPEFHSGQDSLALFISEHLRYPKYAKELEKEGKVFVKFVVEPDGRISNLRVVKTFDGSCAEEALRVLKFTSGKWKPGKQRGKKVRVNIVQPVIFKLSSSKTQTNNQPTIANNEIEEKAVPAIIETLPKYPGGDAEMYKFIGKHLKYPKKARRKGIEGMVIVQFTVDKEGNVTDPKVLRDIGYGCGEAALKVVKKMPKWTPGSQRDKPVPVRMTLPFNFKLK